MKDFDATPNQGLPIRILEAHIESEDWSPPASLGSIGDSLAPVLNEWSRARNQIIKSAIEKLRKET